MRHAIDAQDASPQPKQSWQNRRSAATKRAVLEATVQCLVEHGYANTTTQLVADTVGLSRGAMVHHFATRIDLIGAVIDFVFIRMLEMAYGGLQKKDKKQEFDLQKSTELQWSVIKSPEYISYIELNIASRSDAALRVHFDKKARAFDQLWLEKSEELLPYWGGDRSKARFAWNFARATLEGLMINERIVSSVAERKRIRNGLAIALEAFRTSDIEMPK